MANITKQKQFLIEKFLRSKDSHPYKLNAADRILMLILASYMGKKDKCYPSYRSLLKDTGIGSHSTLSKSIEKLEKLQILTIEYFFKKNNKYSFKSEFIDRVLQICSTLLQICNQSATYLSPNNRINNNNNNLFSNTENQSTSANQIKSYRADKASPAVEEHMKKERLKKLAKIDTSA